jgi:hypothetical protein
MEPRQHFQVGDCVRTTKPLAWLPLGSIGTIRRVFSVGRIYDMRFDGSTMPRAVRHDCLELVERQSIATEIWRGRSAV